MRKITIVLADDHNVVREGLRAILDCQPDFSVIGEAADGLDATPAFPAPDADDWKDVKEKRHLIEK